MQLKMALERAEKDEKVKKLRGYYLGSCFACIKEKTDVITEWTLLYYNKENGMAIDCFVNDKFVTVGSETRPLNNIEKMDVRDVSVEIDKALQIVNGKFSKKTINILITLHHRARMLWTINMISADMNATTYDMDAKTGKILKEETTSLIRKV